MIDLHSSHQGSICVLITPPPKKKREPDSNGRLLSDSDIHELPLAFHSMPTTSLTLIVRAVIAFLVVSVERK